jgi:uncharacterized heparinase superfamily protein
MEQRIRQRAYELYEQCGRTDGYDLDDWLRAEREIKGTQANAAAAWLPAVLDERLVDRRRLSQVTLKNASHATTRSILT